jgi:3-hydroxyisobutyrate dehydrogenase-like beta-hydroxyacid dehydrogenase
MVRHLLSRGFEVHVFDLDAAALARATALGAIRHPTPVSVADAAEAVLVCLPTPDVVRAVALGPDGIVNGRKAKIYVDHSTTGRLTKRVRVRLTSVGFLSDQSPFVYRLGQGPLKAQRAGVEDLVPYG